MSNKKILTWALIISGVILVALVVAGWMVYPYVAVLFRHKRPETPPALREPRIVVGAEFLSRNQFVTTKQFQVSFASMGIGRIEDISVGELDSHPGADVAIAGQNGAVIVDRNGVKRSQVLYEFEVDKSEKGIFSTPSLRTMLGDVQIIDLEADGTCEYLTHGSLDGAAVFSHEGKRLWSYGAFTDEKTSIDDLTAGDINGDGVSEFIAGWNGLEMFDRHGNKAWAQPWEGSLFQIEVVDVDGDRKNEILHSNGRLIIRDGQGQTIKEVEMPFYLSHFHLCAMHGQEGPPHILAVAEEHVWLTDFNGKVVHKFAAPLSRFSTSRKAEGDLEEIGPGETSVYKAKGVWVRLKQPKPFLAVVTNFAAIDRSVLYIYSADGRLVYQEVMPEQCSSIAVLSHEDGRRAQELLIGGSETVWRYNAR